MPKGYRVPPADLKLSMSSRYCTEQIANLLLDGVVGEHRPGNLFVEEVSVPSPEAMNRHLDSAFAHAQLLAQLAVAVLRGIAGQAGLQAIECVRPACLGPLGAQPREHTIEHGTGPTAIEQHLGC